MDLHGDSPVRRRSVSAPAETPAWQEGFWQSLPAELFRALPSDQSAELLSFRQESDPEIFAHSLMNFAGRREKEGDSNLALRLYQILSVDEDLPGELQRRAQARASALQGQGTVGDQAEVLISRFFDESMAPAPILAMGLAGSTFKLSRALGLNFLRRAPLDISIAKAAANGLGLVTESAVFTLASKSVAGALGHTQDWSESALKREWFAGTLLLGSLKVGGALAQRGGRSLAQAAYRSEQVALQKGFSLAAAAAQPLGLYSGIMLAHHVQAGLGLRPHQDGDSALVDGAATLLHLYVGGALANKLGAERLNRGASELEMRIDNLPRPDSFFDKLLNPTQAIAVAGRAGERISPPPLDLNKPLFMAVQDPLGQQINRNQEIVSDYANSLPSSTHHRIKVLYDNYTSGNAAFDRYRFLFLLAQAPVGRDFAALDAALPTLSEATKFSEASSSSSSYAQWLIRQIYQHSLDRYDGEMLQDLIHFLASGGKVADLEAKIAINYPEAGFPKGPPPMPHFWRGRQEIYGQIRNPFISSEARLTLSKWVSNLLSLPNHSFKSNINNLLTNLDYNLGLPGRAPLIDRAIVLAGRSPMAMARMARLEVLLSDGRKVLTPLKLAELADPEIQIFGSENAWSSSLSPSPSQSNAYLGDRAPLAIIAEMQRRKAELIDPDEAKVRSSRRDGILDSQFPAGIGPQDFRPEVLAESFRRFGDPTSLAVAKAILRGDFNLEIRPRVAFQHRANEFTDVKSNDLAYYFLSHNSRAKGIMLIRQPEIQVYSRDSARKAYFGLMTSIVHEYRHHLDITPEQKRSKDVHLYQEMSAHFAEYLWRAEHGDTHNFATWVGNQAMGPALRFHDYYENVYGRWWKEDSKPSDPQQTFSAGRQGP